MSARRKKERERTTSKFSLAGRRSEERALPSTARGGGVGTALESQAPRCGEFLPREFNQLFIRVRCEAEALPPAVVTYLRCPPVSSVTNHVRSFVPPRPSPMAVVAHPGRALAPLVVGLIGGSAALVYFLRTCRRQTSRRALDLLRVVDSGVLEAELERRRVGSHVFNTTVRPLHALRSQLLNAELLTLGIDVAADELAPGPPRKAYDSFARPRDGEPAY